MNDNTKLPDHYFAPGTLAQQEINRLTVDAHMMASTLESTSASLTEAQARNVQLAAALEMVQGECGLLMGKVAKWEARDSGRAPSIDAIALTAATSITRACFAGVPGARMTERVRELVAEAMRACRPVAAPAGPIDRDTPSGMSPWESMCRKGIAVLNQHIVPDGISDSLALTELYGIFDGEEFRSTGVIEQDRCDQRQAEAAMISKAAAIYATPRAVPLPADQGASSDIPFRLRKAASNSYSDWADLLNAAANEIDRLSAASLSLLAGPSEQPAACEWISVDDRLPATGQQVIAYRPTAHISNDPTLCITFHSGRMQRDWQEVEHGFDCLCHPSHWMPLPATPSAKPAEAK